MDKLTNHKSQGTQKEHNKLKIDGQIDKSQSSKLLGDCGIRFPSMELDITQ